MIQTVIFDIDGTLIDSVQLHARCWARAFEKFGKHVPVDLVRWQIGKGGDQLIPTFLTPRENERFGKELDEYRSRLWKRRYIRRVVAIPGAHDLVARCFEDGRSIVLASSAKEDELERYVKLLGIGKFLDVKTSADDAEKSKPHPDIFHAALAKAGVPPERALVVGDTPYDSIGASRAGMQTIGVLTGGWRASDLRAAGCFAVYVDAQDLLNRYDESPIRRIDLYREATPLAEMVP